jgi:hypothetical protein
VGGDWRSSMKQRTRRKPAQSYLKKRWTIEAHAVVSSLQRNRAAEPRRDDKSHRMMDKTGAGPGTVVCKGVRPSAGTLYFC